MSTAVSPYVSPYVSAGVSTGVSTGRAYVPLSVAWLDSLALEVSATRLRGRGRAVQYVMAAHHRPSGTRWTVSRPFDAYRDFQRTLRAALQRGHSCHAQCPWLFTFVASYFPKPSLFRSSSSDRVVKARCATLATYMETLRSALLAKENHSCPVLTGPVAEELTAFLCATSRGGFPLKQWAFAAIQRFGESAESSPPLLEEDDDSTDWSSQSRKPLLIDRVLAETVTTDDDDSGDAGDRSPAAGVCRVCQKDIVGKYYTVTLACGHEFHDECAVKQLNHRMNCPACGVGVAH